MLVERRKRPMSPSWVLHPSWRSKDSLPPGSSEDCRPPPSSSEASICLIGLCRAKYIPMSRESSGHVPEGGTSTSKSSATQTLESFRCLMDERTKELKND